MQQIAADIDTILEIHRALSDPGRIRALLVLRERELCVCHLVELLELSASTVSRHMSQLRRAGLVEVRRDGRWTWYRRPTFDAATPQRRALRGLDKALADTDLAARDRRMIHTISCAIDVGN